MPVKGQLSLLELGCGASFPPRDLMLCCTPDLAKAMK